MRRRIHVWHMRSIHAYHMRRRINISDAALSSLLLGSLETRFRVEP
jgi:hypothetical protein